MTLPSSERTVRWIWPVPWQMSQVAGEVPGCAARAVAGLAEHGRVDLEVAVRAEDDVLEVDLDAQQGVLAPLGRDFGPGAAALPPPKKVSKMSPKPPKPPPRRRRTWPGAEVVAPGAGGVAEHVVGVGDVLEPLGGIRARVHVGVQLAGEPSVGPLDLVGRCVALDAQHFVMVSHQGLFRRYAVVVGVWSGEPDGGQSLARGASRGTGRRRAPRRCCWSSPFASARARPAGDLAPAAL